MSNAPGNIKRAAINPKDHLMRTAMDYQYAAIDTIHPSPTNPRKSFPAEEMAEMIDSVTRHGVLQPVLVRPWPVAYAHGGATAPLYELVAGERRYRAAKGAGLENIPAMVRNLSDHEVLEIQIIENLQRKGLHPIEEAEGYALMIQDYGYTADQLAEKIGKSRAYIYGRMKLTALSMPARLAFRDGKLTASTALLIARIPGEGLQVKAIDKITAGYNGILSYRDAAEVIQEDFCLYLDEASFPQENLLLVPGAGACSACPKRSGSNPELFADITRADVCTDPECHQQKTSAWLAYRRKQAEDEGKTVISGEAAKKIDIGYSHDKYVPLDRRNYELDGAPTYRDTVAQADIETVLIEDHRTGKLVEAVERKALASALEAAGVKPERDYRLEERELERRVRAENEYRRRLFATWHTEMQDQLASDPQPDFEPEELQLVASTLWSSLYGESQEVVMGYWAQPSTEKEVWTKRHAMTREVAARIPTMSRRELILLMIDCALASGGRASANSVDTPPTALIERARACGIDPERIRNDIAAEKAAKTTKNPPAKTTSTPSKAPLGEALDSAKRPAVRPYVLEEGDRVQVKLDSHLINKGKLGYFRGLNQVGNAIVWLDGEIASYICHPDNLDPIPVTDDAPPPVARGRMTDQKTPSSAPAGANAKPCAAEPARCVKTLELPSRKGIEMNEKPLCIYHHGCTDGFAAAWAVRKHYGDGEVEFHPGIYGEAPPDVTGRVVILVDFSYKRPVLLAMIEQAACVLILDHHKTAEADLADLPGNNTVTVFDMTRSGAMLAWNWFHPNKLPPVLFDHIQDRDLWQFKLHGTREITAALYSHPMEFAVWDILLYSNLTLYSEGTAILRKHDADVDALAHACTRTAYFRGVPAPVANVPYMYASDVGGKLAKGHAFAATYYDDAEGRRWSLRSTPEGADVSQIAEAFGGGGHKHAAGFHMTRDEAIEF
ncbi:MAG: ParB/RepB/Spo0J family partition protein, partial [Sulfuritalea sp.]|nr:ParB/RepB/Spo0J family partition protein [Sulfuritalea sp.]